MQVLGGLFGAELKTGKGPKKRLTKKIIGLLCWQLVAPLQGSDQKRQAFSKRKRGIVLKVIVT